MNGKVYWKQQLPLLFLHFLCMIALTIFLLATGNSIDSIALILVIWFVVLSGCLWKSYQNRKSELDHLLALAEQLEERYLIAEVMERPERADDQVYYQLLKMAGKSMLEQTSAVKRERTEYKDHIEQWVHEIKTPITAMKLLCENHRSDLTKELLVELEKTNRFTEQALYYARSEHTEKDYSVREIRLFDVVHQAMAENKYLLLQNGVNIELQETDDMVYSDEKWVCFILNQLIVNSVKYRGTQPEIKFYTMRQGNETVLCVQDNGIGIDASDLPRIFEKGFTGKNGRNAAQDATGIGLYLCRRLCEKLDIGLCANSEGQGTVIQLSFHVNDFIFPCQ
ncbi:MAG: sensor histidine kinase [Oscillospiraceae bacterium]|nr:sensor histidine kinase [Oscillospiraceae bacterium]